MIDAYLRGARVAHLVRLMVIGQALILAFFIAGTHGWIVPLKVLTTTDFSSFYAAGQLSGQGHAALSYSHPALYAAQEQTRWPGVNYEAFFYPPTYLLICEALARLPYIPALLLFEALGLIFWLRATCRILLDQASWRGPEGRFAMLVLLCVPSVYWTLGEGQNSFLSAGLLAAGTYWLVPRPWLAGMAFGALCYKPHIGLLIPVALLAGRHWGACLAAALTVALLVAASAALYGVGTWHAYLAMTLAAQSTMESNDIALAAHVDPRGVARFLGASPWVARGFQAACSLSAAFLVALSWHRARATPSPGAVDASRAALVAAIPIVMPFALFYDLVMESVAAAWLVRASRRDGWLAGEKTTLAACVAADLLSYSVAGEAHLPMGALVAPGLLWLALRRQAASSHVERP